MPQFQLRRVVGILQPRVQLGNGAGITLRRYREDRRWRHNLAPLKIGLKIPTYLRALRPLLTAFRSMSSARDFANPATKCSPDWLDINLRAATARSS